MGFNQPTHNFNVAKQKPENNHYTAKPKGLECIELEKIDDSCTSEIAGGSAKDVQDAAAGLVVVKEKKTTRHLSLPHNIATI